MTKLKKQIVTKIKNSNFDKTQELKIRKNKKNKIVTKLKKIFFFTKINNSNCDKTKKNSNCNKTQKTQIVKKKI